MKKIVFLIVILLLYSCSNHSPLDKINNEAKLGSVKKYSTSNLIKEKFLEFHDLNLLLNVDSKFQDEIKGRLKGFTVDSLKNLEITKDSKIENIHQKGVLETISDSVQKTKITFDIRTENSLKKDSIFVFLFKKRITIDGIETISTKVKFSTN